MSEKMINVLSIDAWRYDGGWTWNAWYKVGSVPLSTCNLKTRTLLRYMREHGFLSEKSKGLVTIEDDGYNVVIVNRHTYEPIFALEYGPVVDSD